MKIDPFDLTSFLPYLLNMAAEESSLGFRAIYKERYGMLRTEWRVLFHLGRYGEMTASDICDRAKMHKTKVSRAVATLERQRRLVRQTSLDDRRVELLNLSKAGWAVYEDLSEAAKAYDKHLSNQLTREENEVLRVALKKLSRL